MPGFAEPPSNGPADCASRISVPVHPQFLSFSGHLPRRAAMLLKMVPSQVRAAGRRRRRLARLKPRASYHNAPSSSRSVAAPLFPGVLRPPGTHDLHTRLRHVGPARGLTPPARARWRAPARADVCFIHTHAHVLTLRLWGALQTPFLYSSSTGVADSLRACWRGGVRAARRAFACIVADSSPVGLCMLRKAKVLTAPQ